MRASGTLMSHVAPERDANKMHTLRTPPIAPLLVTLGSLLPRAADAQIIARVRFGDSPGFVAVERMGSLTLYDRATTGSTRVHVTTRTPRNAVWTDGHLAVPVEGAVQVFDLTTGATTASIPWTRGVRSLSLDPSGRRLLVQAPEGDVRVFDLPGGQALGEIRGARCAALSASGEIVTANDRAVERRASPSAPPAVVPLRGARAPGTCELVRGGTLLVANTARGVAAYDAASGRQVLGPTPARGDNLVPLLDELAGGAPVVRLPVSSSQVASMLDLRVGLRVDARYAPPRCVPVPDSRCPPASHTYIVGASTQGDGVMALGVRDVDDDYGRDTVFLVNGSGGVRVVAERVPESAFDGISPNGAWVVRLRSGSPPMVELTPTAGGEPRRAPCAHDHVAFGPDGRTMVTWGNDAATLWHLDESALTPTPLR